MFNYLYYRIFSTYKYKWKDNIPGVYAVCILSILQFFNILSVLYTVETFSMLDLNMKKIYYGLFVGIIIALNYYRYNFLTLFCKLEKKWKNEPKNIRIVRGYFVITYILLSVFIILYLANYTSSNN